MMAYIVMALMGGGMLIIYLWIKGELRSVKNKNYLLIAAVVMMAAATLLIFATSPSGSHRCAICGSTKNLRQITAKTSSGQWDPSWYCAEHYADAWQYYYGK